jgi:pyruvate dehydrogenase E2 component (dihydrolipoamide acetyltransferase)
MKIFKLPDLGEGLPNAEIREWYVKVGDVVKVDQPLVAMETAKALVDVPSPYAGKIEKLFGNVGDTIDTHQPLIGFEGESDESAAKPKDAGTVVGAIESSEKILEESATGVAAKKSAEQKRVKATPAVRMLAKQLGVNIENITPATGDTITAEDVKRAITTTTTTSAADLTSLSNVGRAMLLSMTQSQAVARVTLVDDADLHAWADNQDMTIRVIRAVQAACQAVPLLNAYFNAEKMGYKIQSTINIGIAVDTEHGLYVPVVKDVAHQDDSSLRKTIDRFKQHAQDRSFPQADLQGATIMLSNFGTLAGRYANPIIVPPMVAIVGVGRARDGVVAENGKAVVHRILPLAISTDHRLITGGEMARFLKVLIDTLQQPK